MAEPTDHRELMAKIRSMLQMTRPGSLGFKPDRPIMDQMLEMLSKDVETLTTERAAVAGWLPITSAPTDGTYVLVMDDEYWDSQGLYSCEVARFIDGAWRYAADEYSINPKWWKPTGPRPKHPRAEVGHG